MKTGNTFSILSQEEYDAVCALSCAAEDHYYELVEIKLVKRMHGGKMIAVEDKVAAPGGWVKVVKWM